LFCNTTASAPTGRVSAYRAYRTDELCMILHGRPEWFWALFTKCSYFSFNIEWLWNQWN